MIDISIQTLKGTKVADMVCNNETCMIGKHPLNFVVLHGWNVGKQHAELTLDNGEVFIKDLGARSGVKVNGETVKSFGPLTKSDKIIISSYQIVANPSKGVSAKKKAVEISNKQELPSETQQPTDAEKTTEVVDQSMSDVDDVELTPNNSVEMRKWRSHLHNGLLKQFDLRRTDLNSMSDEELWAHTETSLAEILDSISDLPESINRKDLLKQVLQEAVGLGPLEDLLSMENVSEIMVNSPSEIFYEKEGTLHKSAVTFTDDKAVIGAIERIVAPLGRRIDEGSPMVDARLSDGSRVNAIIPPLALKGPCITIRRFMKQRLKDQDYVNYGSANSAMMNFIRVCVKYKRNCVISGGTGSGKTTLLNLMSNHIPDTERIITVEDAAELKLYQPNLVSLEARPPNQEGSGAVSIRELVKNCLRMRPDRIVVGECRGGEALDMLQAMNTGHDGSLTTAHANSPRDCISRIEVMVMMAGMDLPIQAIREQIASAVNIIVQQTRFSCGSRKITSMCEVNGIESGVITLSEIFRYKQTGYKDNGKIDGYYEATGLIPEFFENLSKKGIAVDLSIFSQERDH